MSATGTGQNKGLILKTATVWLSICLLVGFIVTARSVNSPANLTIIPDVPKTGEPIVATFNISNPQNEESATSYWLYVNGQLVESGNAIVAPHQSIKHQYVYQNYLERGEQVTFLLRTASERGEAEKIVSIPAYPPQVMSSFVSFAAFSTSVMSSLVSMEYFTSTFGTGSGPNAGMNHLCCPHRPAYLPGAYSGNRHGAGDYCTRQLSLQLQSPVYRPVHHPDRHGLHPGDTHCGYLSV